MTSCSKVEIRRCRPLLGTFVEITVSGLSETELHAAADAAFAAMARIQDLMSVHDEKSELSRVNREAALNPVTVSRETFDVLRRADRLASESNGAFDYTIAPVLARWGMLPRSLRRSNPGGWKDVLLLRPRQVYFLRPLSLDLGGIAKGFAVDRAIEVMQSHGVSAAVVNAGGDLRVIGFEPSTVHIRHPSEPQMFAGAIQLHQAALATSSPCFTERRWNDSQISHLVNPGTRLAVTGNVSATVRARECWLADALTKVVLNSPDTAPSLLAKYDAEMFLLAE